MVEPFEGLYDVSGDGRWLVYQGGQWVEPAWSIARRQAEERQDRLRELKRIEHNQRQRERTTAWRRERKIVHPVEHNDGRASWTPTMTVILELVDTSDPLTSE